MDLQCKASAEATWQACYDAAYEAYVDRMIVWEAQCDAYKIYYENLCETQCVPPMSPQTIQSCRQGYKDDYEEAGCDMVEQQELSEWALFQSQVEDCDDDFLDAIAACCQ